MDVGSLGSDSYGRQVSETVRQGLVAKFTLTASLATLQACHQLVSPCSFSDGCNYLRADLH